MTNTSSHPVTVDGVRLDNLAYNITTKQGFDISIGARGSNFVVPGRDGELWVPYKRENPGRMVLQMWVRGANEDGAIPKDQYELYRSNLDKLRLLFGVRDHLLDIRQYLGANLGWRRWWGEVVEEWVPSLQGETLGYFSVGINLPGTFGEDTQIRKWRATSTGTKLAGPFNGSTAPLRDCWIRFQGPWVNPSIRDEIGQHDLALSYNLAAGETWVVNPRYHSSVVGTNLGYVSGGAGTTNVLSLTTRSGSHTPLLFGLTPSVKSPPKVTIGGSGLSSSSWVEIAGTRKYR